MAINKIYHLNMVYKIMDFITAGKQHKTFVA